MTMELILIALALFTLAALDDAAETHDRLEAALARKVEINVR